MDSKLIEMAREAGLACGHIKAIDDKIARFAELVRQDEREACAMIARDGCLVPPDGGSPSESERVPCEEIAAAIRARGKQ
jgi:hypothetical protein